MRICREAIRPHMRAAGQSKDIRELCQPDAGGKDLLKQAITKLGLSARAYDRILIVATILVTLHMTTSLRLGTW